jgi:seryl-tRNA synthetase
VEQDSVYKKGARLQRALINYFLDKILQRVTMKYKPHMVNEASAYGRTVARQRRANVPRRYR